MDKLKERLDSNILRIVMFIAFDIVALVLSSFIALGLCFDFNGIPAKFFDNLTHYFVIDSIILVLVFSLYKLYLIIWSYASPLEIFNLGFACITFAIIEYVYKKCFQIGMPRSYYLAQFDLLIFFTLIVRFSFGIKKTLASIFSKKNKNMRIMLVGSGDEGKTILNEVLDNSENDRFNICCIIDEEGKREETIRNIPIVGDRTNIVENCMKYKIDEIVIAMPSLNDEEMSRIVEECRKTKCKIKILPYYYPTTNKPLIKRVRPLTYEDFIEKDEVKFELKKSSMLALDDEHNDVAEIEESEQKNANFYNKEKVYMKSVTIKVKKLLFAGFKFCFDRTVALIGLVIASPIMIIIAIAIKLDSKGPVLFKQERTGKKGKKFYLYKFRTMVANNDVRDFSKGDEHTKLGTMLRKTSLDEIPQLINILKAEMSFIGPRPWIHEYYENMTEEQRHRFDVRPGITGLAQANGRNTITIFDKINYDLEYIENYSLRQDIIVILLTIVSVLSTKGADAGKQTIQDELKDLKEYNGKSKIEENIK